MLVLGILQIRANLLQTRTVAWGPSRPWAQQHHSLAALSSPYSHLDDGSKVLAIDSILRLQIEVTQLAGTHGVVLVIELVKALKCLPPLE